MRTTTTTIRMPTAIEGQKVNSLPFVIRTSYRIPRREYTRDVPKHFDGGDIDGNGQWYGADMGCLECRETRPMTIGITATYLLKALTCGECGATFAEYWI